MTIPFLLVGMGCCSKSLNVLNATGFRIFSSTEVGLSVSSKAFPLPWNFCVGSCRSSLSLCNANLNFDDLNPTVNDDTMLNRRKGSSSRTADHVLRCRSWPDTANCILHCRLSQTLPIGGSCMLLMRNLHLQCDITVTPNDASFSYGGQYLDHRREISSQVLNEVYVYRKSPSALSIFQLIWTTSFRGNGMQFGIAGAEPSGKEGSSFVGWIYGSQMYGFVIFNRRPSALPSCIIITIIMKAESSQWQSVNFSSLLY